MVMKFFEEIAGLNKRLIKCIQSEDFDTIDEIISRREEIITAMKEIGLESNISENIRIAMKNQEENIKGLFEKSMKQAKDEIYKVEQNKRANLRYSYVENNYKKIYKKV